CPRDCSRPSYHPRHDAADVCSWTAAAHHFPRDAECPGPDSCKLCHTRRLVAASMLQKFPDHLTMASSQTPLPSSPAAASGSTPIPKSYAKGIAMTREPLEACAELEHGGDRSFAWSVNQQVVQTPPTGYAKVEQQLLATLASRRCSE